MKNLVFNTENIVTAIIMIGVSIMVGLKISWEMIIPIALVITGAKVSIDLFVRKRRPQIPTTAMFICIPSIIVMTVMSYM